MNSRRGALSRAFVSAQVIAHSAVSESAVHEPRTSSDEMEVATKERGEKGVRVSGEGRWRGRAK